MKRRPPDQPTLDELVFRKASDVDVMPEAPAELPADVPRADCMSPITDAEHGIYFWQTHDYVPAERRTVKIQLSSHVTPVTPRWCAACKVAFADHCVCECAPRP